MSWLQSLLVMGSIIAASAAASASEINPQPKSDKRAAFSQNDREWIIREAYACSRNPGINEGGPGCADRERNARQLISERSQDYLRRAQPMREEMRRIHEMNSDRK